MPSGVKKAITRGLMRHAGSGAKNLNPVKAALLKKVLKHKNVSKMGKKVVGKVAGKVNKHKSKINVMKKLGKQVGKHAANLNAGEVDPTASAILKHAKKMSGKVAPAIAQHKIMKSVKGAANMAGKAVAAKNKLVGSVA